MLSLLALLVQNVYKRTNTDAKGAALLDEYLDASRGLADGPPEGGRQGGISRKIKQFSQVAASCLRPHTLVGSSLRPHPPHILVGL